MEVTVNVIILTSLKLFTFWYIIQKKKMVLNYLILKRKRYGKIIIYLLYKLVMIYMVRIPLVW